MSANIETSVIGIYKAAYKMFNGVDCKVRSAGSGDFKIIGGLPYDKGATTVSLEHLAELASVLVERLLMGQTNIRRT